MRFAVAIAVIAVTLAAAVYIHQRHTWASAGTSVQTFKSGDGYVTGTDTLTRVSQHPSWEDPVAVLLAIGGVAVAVGIVATGTRTS